LPFDAGRIARLEQLGEERAIVDHRLAEVLRRGLLARVRDRDPVRRPVVVHDLRVVDGDVRSALLEVFDGVAALPHHLLDQHVGLCDRAAGIVHEARLGGAPRLGVAIARLGAQRLHVELLAPLPALGEIRLRLALRRRVGDGPVVLRPEALPERPRASRAQRAPDDEREHHDRGDRDQGPNPTWHDSLLSARTKEGSVRRVPRPENRKRACDRRARY
jgi:hypothetical protein